MRQTAVDYLVSKLPQRMLNYLKEEIEQAKQMHKEEIMDAYDKGEWNDGMNGNAEQYYNETYEQQHANK